MKTAGIICEYNPFHAGHEYQIKRTRELLGGDDTAIVCAMSGNFVQRGEFAIFEKHARARCAVSCGADLVVEIPFNRALSSAEGFAMGGVGVLDALGICDAISFGSECGDIELLSNAADALLLPRCDELIKEHLSRGISYAEARQAALCQLIGSDGDVLSHPNNLLGIEYIKALRRLNSKMLPITIPRRGSDHDGAGCSGKSLRSGFVSGQVNWDFIPENAAKILRDEIACGHGPVFTESQHGAMLAVLRRWTDLSKLPDNAEGLDNRLEKYIKSETSIVKILERTKTKRYAMSRLRRMLLCGYLGITDEIIAQPPMYINVLAMNRKGMKLLKAASQVTKLPIITKPASAKKIASPACDLYNLQAELTDLYVLAYPDEAQRTGSQEWTHSPDIVE